MAIQAKLYANKNGKAEGVKNKVQITMDVEDAEGIASGDKALRGELAKAVKAVAKEDRKYKATS